MKIALGLSHMERLFVKCFIFGCLVVAGASLFLYPDLATGITLAGLLVGATGLLASEILKTPRVLLMSLASFGTSTITAPLMIQDSRDLIGFEAILVALCVGTAFQLYRRYKRRQGDKAE